MSTQRYERVAAHDAGDHGSAHPTTQIPNSPPPSFRSRMSSRRTSYDDSRHTEEERDLDDAFDAPSDDDEDADDEDGRDRRRLIPGERSHSPHELDSPILAGSAARTIPERSTAEVPNSIPGGTSSRILRNSQVNDGVWANISAKPRPGEDLEEKPPTYEQAAADATPPYWETTIMSPYGYTGNPDDVFVDGLLVGSMFSFIWNALISMSFQLIGFLLTYLLHTTHAAKHGSRAGLGITLIQYGFQMRYANSINSPGQDPTLPTVPMEGIPADPNSHDFDPGQIGGDPMTSPNLSSGDWLSYVLMIVGWFILIRAVSDFLRARRQEALVRSSPDRGLGVAVVAENESPETSV